MTPAYRKGAQNEVNPLNWRPDFVPHAATIPLLWNGEVRSEESNAWRKS
jgi:hypothetical protein